MSIAAAVPAKDRDSMTYAKMTVCDALSKSRTSTASSIPGIRRLLTLIGAFTGTPPPAAATTRIMQVRGADYYVYASDPGLFEPLVELGAEVEPGTPAALIHPHDTPLREPAAAAFTRAGTVICKRVPSRVERGDCLFHLA
jgi:uncharacterized protein